MKGSSCARFRYLVVATVLGGAGCYDFSLPADPEQPTTTSSGDSSASSNAATSVGGAGGQGGGTSVTSVGGQGGAAGGAGGSEVCDGPQDCGPPGECKSPTCDDNACGFTFDSEGAPCDLGGVEDGYCSGAGECFECLGEVNCPEPAECQIAVCDGTCQVGDDEDGAECDGGVCLHGVCDIDLLCMNGEIDAPNETDTDCGGTCPSCGNGYDCVLGSDCQSGFCDPFSSTCQACLDDEGCTDKDDGAACADASECASHFCVDEVCCDSACDGQCESCGGTGSCDPIPDGLCSDCVTSMDCPSDEACDAGSCVVNRAAQVSVGTTFSCARDEKGRVYCWGSNAGGQLGDGEGDGAAHPNPVRIDIPTPAIDVATGFDSFACAIVAVAGSPNQLYCWGANLLGNIGVSGVGFYSPEPVPISFGGQTVEPLDVELGDLLGCVTTLSGPFCWGRNEPCAANPETPGEDSIVPPARVPWGNTADRVIVGERFACVTRDADGPYCWGANDEGQQGTAVAQEDCAISPGAPFNLGNVTTHLGNHSCAPSGGDVACWGSNSAGQIGSDPKEREVVPPVAVEIVGDPTEIALGVSISCALSLGDWYCWGATFPGFAPMSHLPTAQPGIEGLVSLSLGESHGCGIDSATGYVFCFGNDDAGMTGNESTGPAPSRVVLPAP